MKKTWIAFGLVVTCFILLALFSRQKLAAQGPPSHPGIPIGTAQITVTKALFDQNSFQFRAFVPTRSTSPKCLATMNDFSQSFDIPQIMCAERQPSASGSIPGVLIRVFPPFPPPDDYNLTITIYQEGALMYGTPALCQLEDGC